MKAKNLRILSKFYVMRRRNPSDLFVHLALIKDAWEAAGFGVPTIIQVLREAGATEGLSLSNVQGFVERAKKKGLIGEKGCRKNEVDDHLKDFEVSHPISEEISPAGDGDQSDPLTATGKSGNKGPKRKHKGRAQKTCQQVQEEIGDQSVLASGKETVILPEKGPIDEKTWLAFAEQAAFPLDPSGNIDCNKYAQQLGREAVERLEYNDYQRLAGFIKSWRAHPDRNITQTWVAGISQKVSKLTRQMRLAVGLK